ncbi:NAD(P)-binding protein [Lojkania enalia]|uniref:NAD(P)-binding protein n=1 Tax=Lojkania enalia TaxID=147567 RepID=A0A9P4N1N6_9PLEO|nr:NAD(P)-binding protein [Didymosphaeria enalia]
MIPEGRSMMIQVGESGLPGQSFLGGSEYHHSDIYPSINPAVNVSLSQPGKVVLVTGAGRGIGRDVALQYAHASVASIVLCARTSSELDEVEASIKAINTSIRVHKFMVDVKSEELVKACADSVRAAEGRLDVLVNNAGKNSDWVKLSDCDTKDWWDTLDVNLHGAFLFLHRFIPLLAETAQKNNTIVDIINVVSIGAIGTLPGASAYAISKLALLRLGEFIHYEYGNQGVNVIGIHPGSVRTKLSETEPELEPFWTDTSPLAGGCIVWLTAEGRTWLSGRYVSVNWDVNRLLEMKNEIVEGDKLKMKMVF